MRSLEKIVAGRRFSAVVMGASAGGLDALNAILPRLSDRLALPVAIVQHLPPDSDDFLARYFDKRCRLRVKEAEDKMLIENGTIYFAPANYHLLVEEDRSFALSTAERVKYSRPAMDVLFETAADLYREELLGIVLTGANSDGTKGIRRIRQAGGLGAAQSPETAQVAVMPESAIADGVDIILNLDEIAPFLNQLTRTLD